MNSNTTVESPRVLVIEDAPEFLQMVVAVLTKNSAYTVETATNGADGLQVARSFDPEVVILDLGLPGMDGVEVCRELRSFTDAYVLMLTGRDDEVDRLVGLAVGADDYMTKPFSTRELMARVQVLLRRPRGGVRSDQAKDPESAAIRLGDLLVDPLSREVHVDGTRVELTKIEFDLLATLAARPEMVFTRNLLTESVWGAAWYGDDHMISVHMANLRKKIDIGEERHIKTVRGVGYRVNVPNQS